MRLGWQPVGVTRTMIQRSSSALLSDVEALRGIIDAVPHPIFVKDAESRFMIMNETMCADGAELQ